MRHKLRVANYMFGRQEHSSIRQPPRGAGKCNSDSHIPAWWQKKKKGIKAAGSLLQPNRGGRRQPTIWWAGCCWGRRTQGNPWEGSLAGGEKKPKQNQTKKPILPTSVLSWVVEDSQDPHDAFWLWWWQAGAGEGAGSGVDTMSTRGSGASQPHRKPLQHHFYTNNIQSTSFLGNPDQTQYAQISGNFAADFGL